jgi:hypothetical protein
VVDDEGEGDENEDEEKHVSTRVTLHGEVDVKLCCENEKHSDERENWTWPNKDKNTKENEK